MIDSFKNNHTLLKIRPLFLIGTLHGLEESAALLCVVEGEKFRNCTALDGFLPSLRWF